MAGTVEGCCEGSFTTDEIAALPAVISKHEVARIARVSERTVVREAGKGHLDGAFRVANIWRFNTDKICSQFGQVR